MLTQGEANILINALKIIQSKKRIIKFPPPTEAIQIEAISSANQNEKFIFDVNRKGQFSLKKCTYQTRYKKTIRLLRIDIDGPPHDNPDGTTVECPHIHIYKEGFDLSWAYPLSSEINTDIDDLLQVLIDFLKYNHVQLDYHSFHQEGGLL